MVTAVRRHGATALSPFLDSSLLEVVQLHLRQSRADSTSDNTAEKIFLASEAGICLGGDALPQPPRKPFGNRVGNFVAVPCLESMMTRLSLGTSSAAVRFYLYSLDPWAVVPDQPAGPAPEVCMHRL